jgi:hypothetical protein
MSLLISFSNAGDNLGCTPVPLSVSLINLDQLAETLR